MNEPVFFAVAYFLLMFSIGIYSWFKIRTPSDYYVAGKKAGLIPVSSSLLATILGGAAILGTIELGRDIGLSLIHIFLPGIAAACLNNQRTVLNNPTF